MPDAPSRRSLVSRLRAGARAFLLSEEPPESFCKWPGVGRPTLSGGTVTDQTALRGPAVLSSGNAAGTRSVLFLPTSNATVNHAAGVHTISGTWGTPITHESMQIEGAVVTYTTTGAVP